MHIPPGGGPGPHRHDFEESFIVLAGEIAATFRGEQSVVRARETVNIPANAPHSFTNASARPVRLLCICAPSGQEAFFEEIGVPVATRTPPPRARQGQTGGLPGASRGAGPEIPDRAAETVANQESRAWPQAMKAGGINNAGSDPEGPGWGKHARRKGPIMTAANDQNQRIIDAFHANAGKVGGPFAGTPLLLLTTTGAKSGKQTVSPMAYSSTPPPLVLQRHFDVRTGLLPANGSLVVRERTRLGTEEQDKCRCSTRNCMRRGGTGHVGSDGPR
jgi:quercetin dioxygenase-like cupin family protein